jgi:hypothetical protein
MYHRTSLPLTQSRWCTQLHTTSVLDHPAARELQPQWLSAGCDLPAKCSPTASSHDVSTTLLPIQSLRRHTMHASPSPSSATDISVPPTATLPTSIVSESHSQQILPHIPCMPRIKITVALTNHTADLLQQKASHGCSKGYPAYAQQSTPTPTSTRPHISPDSNTSRSDSRLGTPTSQYILERKRGCWAHRQCLCPLICTTLSLHGIIHAHVAIWHSLPRREGVPLLS